MLSRVMSSTIRYATALRATVRMHRGRGDRVRRSNREAKQTGLFALFGLDGLI